MSTSNLASWQTECGKVHGPNWMKWLGHLAGTPAIGMEIGTFEGDSAQFMLENIFTHPDSRYVCVDPFTGSVEHHIAQAAGNMPTDISRLEQTTREKLARFPNVEIVKGYSQDVLPGMIWDGGPSRRFDFIYIDGSHAARDVLRDAVMAFDLLKVGGLMVFDDYEWTVMPDPLDCPRRGIDGFFSAYSNHVGRVPPEGWQRAYWRMK